MATVPIEVLLAGAAEHCQTQGRPLVTLSYAQSLDGSLTFSRGAPFALSGVQASELTHRLRAAHQAILIGVGTLLADDPRLTVRLGAGASQRPGDHPQPIVLDSRLRTPLSARLLLGPRTPWIATCTAPDSLQGRLLAGKGARVIQFDPDPAGQVPLPDVLAYLAGENVATLMVEGGGEVISAFLAAGLVDRVVITIAPLFAGGYPSVQPGLCLDELPRLKHSGSARYGEDVIVWGELG